LFFSPLFVFSVRETATEKVAFENIHIFFYSSQVMHPGALFVHHPIRKKKERILLRSFADDRPLKKKTKTNPLHSFGNRLFFTYNTLEQALSRQLRFPVPLQQCRLCKELLENHKVAVDSVYYARKLNRCFGLLLGMLPSNSYALFSNPSPDDLSLLNPPCNLLKTHFLKACGPFCRPCAENVLQKVRRAWTAKRQASLEDTTSPRDVRQPVLSLKV
jgi:hypothetical protein